MGGTVRRRIYRHSPAEWLLAAEALLLLAFFRVCLVVVPVHRIILTIARARVGQDRRRGGFRRERGCGARARSSNGRDAGEEHRGVRGCRDCAASALGGRGGCASLPRRVCLFPSDAGGLYDAAPARCAEHDGLRRGAGGRREIDRAHMAGCGRPGCARRRGLGAVHAGGAMGMRNRGECRREVQADLGCWRRFPAWAAASASARWWMVKRASSRRSLTPVLS